MRPAFYAAALLLLAVHVHAAESTDASVTVITAQEIAAENPADLMALLRARAGVDHTSGVLTLRGVQGIAVYVDGFASSSDELARLKPQQVERIEILRGGASARFGAGAMGGAILVTTGKRFASTEAEVSQGFKDNGSSTTRASTTRRDGPLSFGAIGEYIDYNGHRAVPEAPFPGQVTVEDEHGRSYSTDLNLGYDGGGAATDLNLKHAWSWDGFGRPNWWWERADTTARLTTRLDPAGPWDHRLAVSWEEIEDDALRDPGTGTDAAGLAPDRHVFTDQNKWETELAATRALAAGSFEVAVSGTHAETADRIVVWETSEPEFTLRSTTLNSAARFRYLWQPAEGAELELGGRYDRIRYSDTVIHDAAAGTTIRGKPVEKEAFSPRAGARWRTAGGSAWSTNFGTGFVPPDPEQLYYEDLGAGSQFLANPDLSPQHSWTWDLGLQRGATPLRWGVNLFYTHWDDKLGVLIVDYGSPEKRQWNNIGAAEAAGVEFEWSRRLDAAWQLDFNYTFNHTRITENRADPALVGNELPYMPAHKANLALARERPGLSARTALRYVGDAFTDERNTAVDANGYDWRQPAYAVVDLTLTKPLGEGRLTFAVENLFDERYMSGFFRRSAGRVVRGELAWRF
jgi:outer membrane receptor protein involved in Fe transport